MLSFVDIPIAGGGAIATGSEAKALEMHVFVDIPIAGGGAIGTCSEAKALEKHVETGEDSERGFGERIRRRCPKAIL